MKGVEEGTRKVECYGASDEICMVERYSKGRPSTLLHDTLLNVNLSQFVK
jgi:hypothetical protein